MAGAVTYGPTSGINDINPSNSSYWSTVLSNNDSTVTTYIIVKNGATLNLSNAKIRFQGYNFYINVNDGAILNINDGSLITATSSSYTYYFRYYSGSDGYIDDSTIQYSKRLEIYTQDNLKITNNTILTSLWEGIYLFSTSGNVNITNNAISNTGSGYAGIHLNSASGNINITNNTISNTGGNGINIVSSSNNILRENTITNTGTDSIGISIASSSNNLLRDNNINTTDRNLFVSGNYDNDIDTSNRVWGDIVYYMKNIDGASIVGENVGHITLYGCSNVSIQDNTLVTNGDGIRLISSTENITIDNNFLSNSNYYGIDLSSSRANITNNTVTTSDQTAIRLSSSHNNNITNNIMSSSVDNQFGIQLSSSNSNNLTNNTVKGTGSSGDGISLSASNNNYLIDNILTGYTNYNGIALSSSDNNNIINNSLKNKNQAGLLLSGGSDSNTIIDNDITNNNYGGITIEGNSINNNISNNEISSNLGSQRSGVTVLSGSNNIINSNTISSNSPNGILVDSAGWNRFSNNILDSNTDNGIYIQTDENYYSNNTITGGRTGYGFYIDWGQYDNYIYQNNTVDSEHIYYYYDTTMQTVDVEDLTVAKVSNVGKISLIKSSNIIIENNVLSGNTYIDGGVPSGIFLYDSTDNTISNNIITNNNRGMYFYNSSNNIINNSNSINTSEDRGIYFNISNYNNITNNIIGLNAITGIYFNFSDHNNITGNDITGSPEGILFNTSLFNNLFSNDITDYTYSGIRLIEYSTNTTMIGNDFTRNGAEFDIHINDSNGALITNNESTAANYTYYLTGDTRLITLDTVINKTKTGYEDTSNLTLMWRVDVFSWDNRHIEPIWGNLTLRYGDYSDVGGILLWDDELDFTNTRLSNNSVDYWGPPDSGDNWLPIIEYKQNATGKINYASTTPMNATVINRWDKLQGIDKSYRNITTTINGPGVTIIVDAGYTPNGKCYYCHMEKLDFKLMKHWTQYYVDLTDMSDPYTPGRCIDCHDKNDSVNTPHGIASGENMLIQQAPQLCYSGNGSQACHSTNAINIRLKQETEFNRTTHHDMGEGKITCATCHNNHYSPNLFDLHRPYSVTSNAYEYYPSSSFGLCYMCHMEEKIKATMTATGYLGGYKNQTNFRDEYWSTSGARPGFNLGIPSFYTVHNGHYGNNCRACHFPHGSNNPAVTKPGLNFSYITNLTPPGVDPDYPEGDWLNQTILDQANWSNSTLNQGIGFTAPNTGEKCNYHTGSYRLPNRFTYREFIDYESAGGPDCVGCHNSSDPGAIRKILNVSALKLAMHANLSWDFRNGGKLNDTDGIGKNWTEWGDARGYNASNISTDNAICWTCHSTNGTPPYAGFHPDRSVYPYRCPKCHGPIGGQPPHTQGLVVAIDNHGPTTKGSGSIFIQTNVGTNGSCPDCHAPSRLPDSAIGTLTVWKYSSSPSNSPDNTPFTGRTTNGDVSHYGLSRSQGEDLGIANPLVNTSNCLFCHTNSTNGAIWGNAPNVSGIMYGADTNNISECYRYCHVLPDYLDIVNETNIPHFHNKSIYSGGGPNCVDCHDVNATYGVQSRVNATSIAQGIHGNLGNNTIELVPGIDPRSKPCWGCHQSNGHEPEGMGDRNGIVDPSKLPWTCEDCHTRSSEWVAATGDGESWLAASYPPNKLPPRIYAHHPNSSSVKTNVNGAGGCVDCHNNSIDPYRNDTAELVLGNTIFSNVSHYGLNRSKGEELGITNPLFNTSNCGICHNSTDNASIWGNATQNGHGNFDDYSAEDGCYACHTIDNQTPVDFHAVTLWSGKGGFDCLNCHNDSGFSQHRRINGSIFGEATHKDVNNASTMEYDLNRSCWACHFENGLNADNHSAKKNPPYLCYDCHNKIGGLFGNVTDAPQIYNHFKSGTNISAYLTRPTDSDSCMGCHNNSEMFYFYLPDENETPSYFTNYSITSHYGSNRTDLVDKYDISNSTEYCSYCHVNISTPFMEYPSDKNIQHAGGYNCSECHGLGRLHEETLTRPQTSANCTDCHALYGNNKTVPMYLINVTAMNLGVHANLNSNMSSVAAASPVNDYNNSKCWGCHVPGGAYPENGHEDTFNNKAYYCYDCHNSTVKAYVNVSSAPAVYNHFKNGVNISARTTASTNSESCGYGCHNLTSMKVAGFDAGGNASYRVNLSQPSHYAKNRTDADDIKLYDDLSDCTWCHRNSTNEFLDIFERNGAPNYTENIPHATQTDSCILADCHKRGRIHDENLTTPTWEWDEQCKDCHYQLDDSAVKEYYVNETMFNEAVHWNVDCTLCHVYIADQPSNWHPIAEYYWKWCEDCHVVQSDPINDTDRHNVTFDPWNYTIGGTSVVNITDCTVCHNAATYNASVDNYETNKCRYCHEYADMGNKTSQSWY